MAVVAGAGSAAAVLERVGPFHNLLPVGAAGGGLEGGRHSAVNIHLHLLNPPHPLTLPYLIPLHPTPPILIPSHPAQPLLIPHTSCSPLLGAPNPC